MSYRLQLRHWCGPTECGRGPWMADNALVCWVAHERPWELEDALVKTLDLPLNLQGNARHPFRAYLRGARAAARDHARALPVWPS
jgi:hypothetical protein